MGEWEIKKKKHERKRVKRGASSIPPFSPVFQMPPLWCLFFSAAKTFLQGQSVVFKSNRGRPEPPGLWQNPGCEPGGQSGWRGTCPQGAWKSCLKTVSHQEGHLFTRRDRNLAVPSLHSARSSEPLLAQARSPRFCIRCPVEPV